MDTLIYLLSTLSVLVLDQASKWAVLTRLEFYERVPLVRGWLYLTLWHNSGGAFGLLQDRGPWLAWIATVVSAGIVLLLWRYPRADRRVNLGLALIAGGALGNLIDRLRWGAVVDFVQVCLPWSGRQLCGFPVFNLADTAIVVGTGLIVLAWMSRERCARVHRL